MKKTIAISAVPLVFLLVTAFQSSNSPPGQLAAIQAKLDSLDTQVAALAAKEPRQFYLTKTGHTGDQALSACAPGYHMASMSEIHDLSNLRYNTELGLTHPDSGFGAPSRFGWLRTGRLSSGSGNAGSANCQTWTSASPSHSGSGAAPYISWVDVAEASRASPWIGEEIPCSFEAQVWCVQD